jgi:YfiH family protein
MKAAMITTKVLGDIAGLRHGFFGREGGVSEGLYASLNCGFGSGDDAGKVAENRGRALAGLDLAPDRLVTCYQVHSPNVVTVEAPWPREENPKADAMVTRRRDLALGILTADCAPVLFADPKAAVIGAAHAGWRGAVSGVVEATLTAMEKLGAERSRVHAAIGPCIAQLSYEVGPEFPAPFLAEDPENARFFLPAPRAGHFLFDLGGYVEAKLQAAGIAAIDRSRDDTARDADRYFSYRRTCLQGEKDYGREISLIALAE